MSHDCVTIYLDSLDSVSSLLVGFQSDKHRSVDSLDSRTGYTLQTLLRFNRGATMTTSYPAPHTAASGKIYPDPHAMAKRSISVVDEEKEVSTPKFCLFTTFW